MPSEDDLHDAIEKTRDAYRRSASPDDEASLIRRPAGHWRGGDAREDAWRDAHPFFQGLFDSLPQPGEAWSLAQREQWLETARSIFALLYHDQAEGPAAHPSPGDVPQRWRDTSLGRQSA